MIRSASLESSNPRQYDDNLRFRPKERIVQAGETP